MAHTPEEDRTARADMDDVDLAAFEPIPFPEIAPGKTSNANFCRNPMYPNCGPAPNLDVYAERYTVKLGLTEHGPDASRAHAGP